MSFHDVRLPEQQSYGAQGGPRYRTTIVENASGFEQRQQEWDYPLFEYSIGLKFWDEASIGSLLDFFHARAGAAYAFRYKDWSDYTAGLVRSGNTWVVGTPVPIGTGTGAQTVFDFVKKYTSGGVTRTRRITRPVSGTAKVYLNGALQSSGYTVDYSTGKVTFTSAPGSGVAVAWAGEFDVPARFAEDQMSFSIEAVRSGAWSLKIVGIRE